MVPEEKLQPEDMEGMEETNTDTGSMNKDQEYFSDLPNRTTQEEETPQQMPGQTMPEPMPGEMPEEGSDQGSDRGYASEISRGQRSNEPATPDYFGWSSTDTDMNDEDL